MTSEDTNARLGASNPVHEPDPNADLSHPAASKQLTQPGVRPPKHFVKQWLAVQSARLPKQVAQPELQPLPAMQEVTQEPLPKHFVPQDVMSFCHCAWPASPLHLVVSASVQEAVLSNAMLGASNPVHEPDPNAALSHPAASKQLTQPGVRPPKHFVKQWLAVQSARLPKQVAQPELQTFPAMQEVTQEPFPKHFVPQVVMSFFHCA
jgi:hypothetical protein